MTENSRDVPFSMERTMILGALEQAHRDKALAARLLGLDQHELQKLIQKYDLRMDGLPGE